jgi:hypothetical protein
VFVQEHEVKAHTSSTWYAHQAAEVTNPLVTLRANQATRIVLKK